MCCFWNRCYQFVVFGGEFGEPLVVFQCCDYRHQVPAQTNQKQEQFKKRKKTPEQRTRAADVLFVPGLQVDEVLQVELSGVLGQIDGVHVLQEGRRTSRSSKNIRSTGGSMCRTRIKKEDDEKKQDRRTKRKIFNIRQVNSQKFEQ